MWMPESYPVHVQIHFHLRGDVKKEYVTQFEFLEYDWGSIWGRLMKEPAVKNVVLLSL
jgi:hypothetical protein